MYVDESGDPGLSGSPTRHFILSGLIVHESHWRQFIDHLVAFRKTLRDVYGFPLRSEIHASELINKRAHNIEKHNRLSIVRNTIDEIAKIDYISITNVVVDKSGKNAGFDCFDVAWRTLFQRFENTLQHGNFPGGHRDDYGLVITDATSGVKLAQLMRKMSVYNPVPNNQHFGPGYRNIPATRIIEDPFGKDSKTTLPIQLADTIAYSLKQKLQPNSYMRKKRAQHYFDRLQPVLNVHATRTNQQGIVYI